MACFRTLLKLLDSQCLDRRALVSTGATLALQHGVLRVSTAGIAVHRSQDSVMKQEWHLGVVHQACAKAFDLLIGSDCTKGDLPEMLLVERTVRDPTNHISFPSDDGHRAMPPIQHQAGNVLSRHVGQLL